MTSHRRILDAGALGPPLLLLFLLAPPPARAQDPSIVCPPNRNLSVELGQGLPLPIGFENPTEYTVTFTIQNDYSNLFNFPNQLGDPRVGRVVLAPHTSRSIPDHAFPIPPSTPLGTDRLVLDVFGKGSLPPIYKIWGPFQCEYDLTVVPPIDFIQIPVRWCVVEGSPQAQGVSGPKSHGGVVQTVPGTKLLGLLQLANDQIFFPQSHVLFRNASAPRGIPVIDDPDGTKFLEVPGEVEIGSGVSKVATPCEQAWSQLYPEQRGTVLVNATLLDKGIILGAAPSLKSDLARIAPTLCRFPAMLDVAALGSIQSVAIHDLDRCSSRSYCPPPTRESVALTLSHELGHSLALGHGDGLDNNGDGAPAGTPGRRLYDTYCDPRGVVSADYDFPVEDQGAAGRSLMNYTNSTTITPLQKETLRSLAKLVPGATFVNVNDPAAALIAPSRACEPDCRLPGDVFLTRAGMAETPPLAITSFWHSVRGPIPDRATNEYLAFLDLDSDSASGCDPAALFADQPGFSGAELVSRVSLSTVSGAERVTPSAWICQGGSWIEIHDPALAAQVIRPGIADRSGPPATAPAEAFVILTLPNALRGPAGPRVRLQAVARRARGEVDRLPGSGRGEVLDLIPPALPECTLTRALLPPGGRGQVRANRLSPNRTAEVWVGDAVVAYGTTDTAGNLAIDFVLPATSRRGYRPVAVVLSGGAENATCGLLVDGEAVSPATVAEVFPHPNGAGWNSSAVTVNLTATDLPGGPGVRDVTYNATGAQPLPVTRSPLPAVSIALAREGRTDLAYFATNRGDVAEAPQTLAVRIDKTAPSVSLSCGRPKYRILDEVKIACSASDALSGIVWQTCRNATEPAYAFAAGTNIWTAEAADFAQNRTAASTSFVVEVTYEDLCTLGERFGRHRPSLCEILRHAQKAQAAGRLDEKRKRLDSYAAEVKKSVPRIFSAEEAETLAKFASACREGSC